MLNDLLDWIEYRLDRFTCRTIGLHGKGCRGRQDHSPDLGRWR